MQSRAFNPFFRTVDTYPRIQVNDFAPSLLLNVPASIFPFQGINPISLAILSTNSYENNGDVSLIIFLIFCML